MHLFTEFSDIYNNSADLVDDMFVTYSNTSASLVEGELFQYICGVLGSTELTSDQLKLYYMLCRADSTSTTSQRLHLISTHYAKRNPLW